MTTTPLPRMPACKFKDMQYQRRYIGDVYTRDQMQAYALAARADLEAENKRLREALKQAVNNPYRSETESYERVMDEARAALENKP